jgi:ribA/ribD-fused uncharacterized protein
LYPNSNLNLSHETDDTVYWFSHAFDPLNNWSANAVKIWGQTFPTVEHGFHYKKFNETAPEVAAEILAAPSPWAAMQIERNYKDKRRNDWQAVKIDIMTELVRAKVVQNDDVRECLLRTGNKAIVENSPWDSFWGIGAEGKGQNQMGKILMQIRSEIS